MAATQAAGPPDLRREQMLHAAAELIGERGFSETRIADVARRAGVSPALVIYYFGTKDELLTEALRYSERPFYADVAARCSGGCARCRERLEMLVRSTCVPAGRGRDPGRVGALVRPVGAGLPAPPGRQGPGRAGPALARHDRERRPRRPGRGRDRQVDAEDFAITWGALLDGLSIQVALQDPVVDSDRALSIAMRMAAERLGFDWTPAT